MPPSPVHKTNYASEALSLLTSRYQKPRPGSLITGAAAIALAPWNRSASGTVTKAVPASISGLAFWVRADFGITIATGVSGWSDISGTGDPNKNLAQSNTAQQPTFNASDSSYNNKPSVSATASHFIFSGTWASAIAQPYTILVVGHCNNSLFYAQQGATDEASFDVGGLGWRVISGASNFSVSATTTTPAVLIGVFNGASSALYVSRATPTTGTLGTNALDIVGLFGTPAGAGTGTATCPEAAIWNRALNSTEIGQLNTYAGSRYNITIGP